MSPPPPSRRTWPVRMLQIAAVVGATLVVLEGLSSLALLGYDLAVNTVTEKAEREGEYTDFDESIGWVARPDVRLDDLFGPGQHLTTNAFGARGSLGAGAQVPAGRKRAVCLGDSFTFGYGVGDDETWPHALETIDPRIETINLGQRGYGIDQAYLWYLRHEESIEHDLVILAFIQDDFRRVRWSDFQGYSKPLLARSTEGGPTVTNAPLARSENRSGWLQLNSKVARSPRVVQLADRATSMLARPSLASQSMSEEATGEVILEIFRDLERRCAERERELVLLFLPSLDPKSPEGLIPSAGWPRQVLERARKEGLRVIDLSLDFEALGRRGWSPLFLWLKDVTYPFAQNHYNAAGNRFAAELLHAELGELGLLP